MNSISNVMKNLSQEAGRARYLELEQHTLKGAMFWA
jgi:hypothetical protein